MSGDEQQRRAQRFAELHRGPDVLRLLNAWDAGTARIFEAEGAPAIGTTSAGVAYSHGRADGALGRERMIAAIGEIAAAVDVPVTADIESGFGGTAAEVGETVAAVLEAGAVGINLEDAADADAPALREVEEQCERIRASRQAADAAGIDLFVNARTDVFWLELEGDDRLEAVMERLHAYVDAGADGVFVPRLVDPFEIERVAAVVKAPLNVLAAPGLPRLADLGRLGARRLSTGSAPSRASLAFAHRMAVELLTDGTFESMLEPTIPYEDANREFTS